MVQLLNRTGIITEEESDGQEVWYCVTYFIDTDQIYKWCWIEDEPTICGDTVTFTYEGRKVIINGNWWIEQVFEDDEVDEYLVGVTYCLDEDEE